MKADADAIYPNYLGVSPKQGFALVLETACGQFEALRSLIRGDVRCVLSNGTSSFREVASINMALAQSFLFFSARAFRICKHGPSLLGLPRDERKQFLQELDAIVDVRDVNEHGYDLHSQTRGRSSRPSMHLHEEHSPALDETSLVILGEDKVLMGPLNLAEVYITVDRMRKIAGFQSMPVHELGAPTTYLR